MQSSDEGDDKAVVKEYFNNTGFDRWKRIYSDDGSVNAVQLDIRTGHQQTVDRILSWIDEDQRPAQSQTFCDAGCGVGSLATPLASRGAIVAASDISEAMVTEARERANRKLGAKAGLITFTTNDLEEISGSYDTVCCIDVMIHYPTEKLFDMLAHLTSIAKSRMIVTFAPSTLLLGALKSVGNLFPGPSKATRAYLHKESDVVDCLEKLGWTVQRTDFIRSKFYFSKIIEVTR